MKTHILKNPFTKAALVALSVTGLSTPRASAQNPDYAPGDLLVFFQQQGGTQTVMANLGAAFTYRDATANVLNIINVGGALTAATPGGAAFGSTWYDDPTLYWGLAGVRSNSTSTTTVGIDGDPGRTLYVSRERASLGTEGFAVANPWIIGTDGGMTSTANAMIQQLNRMETIATTNTLVESTGLSFIDTQHLFLSVSPFTPTTSFGGFTSGGVQGDFGPGSLGTFGGVAAEAGLDLFRLLAVSPAGTVEPGTVRAGQYQGTFVIDQAGSISYIAPIPEPATFGLLASGLVFGLARRRRAPRA